MPVNRYFLIVLPLQVKKLPKWLFELWYLQKSQQPKKLKMPMERVIATVDEHANTSGASIPLAMDLAIRDGRIQRGQTLLLAAFGAGFTWGSAMVRY